VSGKKLNIYLSAPVSLSGNQQAQDAIDAEKLAFSSACTSSCPPIQLNGFTVHLVTVSGDKISDNARTAIQDSDSVAYLGEVIPERSVDSLGITNSQDLLQVSPSEAASVPTKDFESFSTYGRTFASLAPSSSQAARTMLGGSAGKAFARDFRQAFGHAPSAQAIFGYVAMASVLKALDKAGTGANDRGTVRKDFFALKDASLPRGLGTYTVNTNGTVTITPASS
jgi:ABC-type branched-subunit amino acid transport system substrate-binding protein